MRHIKFISKPVFNVFILSFMFSCILSAQIQYERFFSSGSLRIDYYLMGDANKTAIGLEQLKREPFWGGPVNNLTDPLDYGEFRIEVLDSVSGKLIYSRGFSTLFQEWQTTDEARNTTRSFYQVTRIPYPRKSVFVRFLKRGEKNKNRILLETYVNPGNYFIRDEKPCKYKVNKVKYSGDPVNHIDLVFLPEGYTMEEMQAFREDVKRLSGELLSTVPFNAFYEDFNIWAVESPSRESGTDIPGEGIYRNTVMNFSYYTFDISRYLTSSDMKSICDIAGIVPYDHIIVLINTDRYGGGGIYNHYTASTSDNDLSPIVLVHELGHGFAGLADEYYTSDVAYNEFYDLSEEPWEPNITTLVDFGSKWKSMVKKGIPVPTPNSGDYSDVVGVFEGGGYVAKGVYRPYLDCRMKSNSAKGFCPVCQEAIIKMIRYYRGQ